MWDFTGTYIFRTLTDITLVEHQKRTVRVEISQMIFKTTMLIDLLPKVVLLIQDDPDTAWGVKIKKFNSLENPHGNQGAFLYDSPIENQTQAPRTLSENKFQDGDEIKSIIGLPHDANIVTQENYKGICWRSHCSNIFERNKIVQMEVVSQLRITTSSHHNISPNDVKGFLDEIRQTFLDRPKINQEVHQILQKYAIRELDVTGILVTARRLFAGKEDLISKLNTILPSILRIDHKSPDDDKDEELTAATKIIQDHHKLPSVYQKARCSSDLSDAASCSSSVSEKEHDKMVHSFHEERRGLNSAQTGVPTILIGKQDFPQKEKFSKKGADLESDDDLSSASSEACNMMDLSKAPLPKPIIMDQRIRNRTSSRRSMRDVRKRKVQEVGQTEVDSPKKASTSKPKRSRENEPKHIGSDRQTISSERHESQRGKKSAAEKLPVYSETSESESDDDCSLDDDLPIFRNKTLSRRSLEELRKRKKVKEVGETELDIPKKSSPFKTKRSRNNEPKCKDGSERNKSNQSKKSAAGKLPVNSQTSESEIDTDDQYSSDEDIPEYLLPRIQKMKDTKVLIPPPGKIDPTMSFYSSINNETLEIVAEKLGCESWRDIANHHCNAKRYKGSLTASGKLKSETLLAIPTNYNKWKTKALIDNEGSEAIEQKNEDELICEVCKLKTSGDENPILLCDGCDQGCHLRCMHDMTSVPEGDWFCPSCSDILDARRSVKYREDGGLIRESITDISNETHQKSQLNSDELIHIKDRLNDQITTRLKQVEKNLEQDHEMMTKSITTLSQEIDQLINDLEESNEYFMTAQQRALSTQDLRCYKLSQINSSIHEICYLTPDGSWNTVRESDVASEIWNVLSFKVQSIEKSPVMINAKARKHKLECQIKERQKELKNLEKKRKEAVQNEKAEKKRLKREYDSLLNSHNLEIGSKKQKRKPEGYLMGLVLIENQEHLEALLMLCEPEELVIFVPLEGTLNYSQTVSLERNKEYAVIARARLFNKERDDQIPIEHGIRDAQRILLTILTKTTEAIVMEKVHIPPSVKLRSNYNISEDLFDLAALVKDCNCDLDLPKEETPQTMAKHGSQLNSYQKASLLWMIDKERSVLGLTGELWSRMRFMDGEGTYFYCELTGSLALEIFDSKFVGCPSGGILGDEKGLGKTLVSELTFLIIMILFHFSGVDTLLDLVGPNNRKPPSAGKTSIAQRV